MNELREFDKRSRHFPLGDHFINSHNLIAWHCMDIVRRKLMLLGLKGLKLYCTFFSLEKLEVLFLLKEVLKAFSRSQNDKTSNIWQLASITMTFFLKPEVEWWQLLHFPTKMTLVHLCALLLKSLRKSCTRTYSHPCLRPLMLICVYL